MSRFGIGEGDGRDDVVMNPAPLFGRHVGEEIVRQDFRFVVGLVAERRLAVYVADGPDAFGAGFEEFIGHDEAAAVGAYVCMFQMKQVRHGADARRNEDFIGVQFRRLSRRFVLYGQAFFPVLDRGGKGRLIEADGNPVVRKLLQNKGGNIFVFLRQQANVALDDGDLSAGGVEHMGEFAADRAAADDEQAVVGPFRIFAAEQRFRCQAYRRSWRYAGSFCP